MAAAADGCEPPLWRDCVRWLVDVGILSANHKIAHPQGTITEFAALLRLVLTIQTRETVNFFPKYDFLLYRRDLKMGK